MTIPERAASVPERAAGETKAVPERAAGETKGGILATGLEKVYGAGANAVTALHGVSLEVARGELVVLRGPSGSGKTTLLNALAGLDRPTAGTVRLDGTEITSLDPDRLAVLRRTEVGIVFQAFALLPMLSAAENIEVPLRLVRAAAAERSARVAELLSAVGLADHANQRPYELSGGQQQRVGLARALANRPGILIADEPTGQLDSETSLAMMRLIAALVHDAGVAAIVSTHDPAVMDFGDRVLEIRDGRLLAGQD